MDKLWEQLCKKYNYVPARGPRTYRGGMSFHSLQLEPGITWGGKHQPANPPSGAGPNWKFYLRNHMTENVDKLKVIIYGPGRTGISVLTNICFYLFGPEYVYPTHRNKFIDAKNTNGAPLLLAIRDFRNSMVSHWRYDKDISAEEMDDGKQMTEVDLKYYLDDDPSQPTDNFLPRVEYLQKFILDYDYISGVDYQPIYYEKVLGDIPAVLKIIETYFKIQIPDVSKEYLDEKYNVKNKSKYFIGDRNMERNTYNFGLVDWRNHIPENMYDYVYERLESHLKLWGYKR